MRLRNRMLKATFWTDPELLRWPAPKRWFYASLWSCAEDSCCLEDDMFAVKVAAWASPYDDGMTIAQFETWRDELEAAGKVFPYETDGKRCLFLPDMAKHEHPRNPQSPDCPLPAFVTWANSSTDARKGYYVLDKDALQALYNAATTPPALSGPVLPCTDLSVSAPRSRSRKKAS